MDNFRRRQTTGKPRRSVASTDGFVGGAKRTSARAQRDSANIRKIGDFSHGDGFHARARRSMNQTRQPMRDSRGGIALGAAKRSAQKPKRGGWHTRLPFLQKMPKLRTVALVFLIAFGSYFITSAYLKARQVFQGGGGAVALQDNIDPSRLNGEGDGRVNILLLGRDSAGGLTDTIIVASIDPIHDEAALLSIPRDLYVRTEELGSMKINEVFPNVRNQAIVQQATTRQAEIRAYRAIQDTVSEVTGIPMHYYVSIDFEGFRRAIDTVGGVTLDVEDPVYEAMSLQGRRYILDVRPGEEKFDGLRALAYVRSRKTSPRGDYDRSERQREILIGLKSKIMSSETLSNPARINALFNDFADNVTTSFGLDELMRLREIGSKIQADNISSVELVGEAPDNYIVSGNIPGLSTEQPRAGLYDYSEIHNFIRNKLRDGYLRSEDAKVLVINGTQQPELANRTTEELKSYGYSVARPQDAPTKDYRETILVDLTRGEKKYTKRYLEQRMKTFASTSLPRGVTIDDESVDFVILIGQNEITRLQN